MKPRRCSILHDQGLEDDLGLLFKLIWSRSSDSQTSKDKGRPPGSPRLCNKNAPGKQTFMQQSWVKPPQSFPVLLLSNDKCLFYVRIKQSRRQQHKQTSVTLILHVSRVVSKEELPRLPESVFTWKLWLCRYLAATYGPREQIPAALLTAAGWHFNYLITAQCFPSQAGKLQKSLTFFLLQLLLTFHLLLLSWLNLHNKVFIDTHKKEFQAWIQILTPEWYDLR